MHKTRSGNRVIYQGLFVGLLLVVAILHGTLVSGAAPLLQATPTPANTPTPEPTVDSKDPTATPEGSPTVVAQQETPTAEPPACDIEGYVFNDLNRDQEKQPEEPGLSGVRVFLQTENGSPISQQITDGEGFFCFASGTVAPGRYRLVQDKATGYETTGGQVRLINVTEGAVTRVFFANIQLLTSTPGTATVTPDIRVTPSPGPTFTPSNTPQPTPTNTVSPSPTLSPSTTPTSSTTPTVTPTPSTTPTASSTPSPTPTGTLRALTPIATFITTTPGVLVTTTPYPGGPIDRLPDTGSGNNLLLVASSFALLMLGAGVARRLFFSR